ncbi:ImmA/IrrE family metallo-endopeptidase [Agromyces bauzanensis]
MAPERRCQACGQFTSDSHECPGMDGLPSASYADLKGDARTKQMLDDLEEAVQAVVTSGQLQRWLDSMASNGLNRWSWNNRLLAIMQLMNRGADVAAPHLMGFRQWEQLGRRVKKGAKAIWILAPIIVRSRDSDDGEDDRRVVGFKNVPVFNITDTDGDPLPAPPVKPAAGEATPGTLEGLKARVALAGYAYRETEIPGCNPATGEGTQGYTSPQSKEIVIDSRLSPAHKASVIAHELGHVHCGHVDPANLGDYQRHRGRMETEAEMAAYLVTRSRGMHRDQVDAFSPGYIAGWSGGDSSVLKGAMDRATKAYNKIINGDWPTD